MRPMQIRQPEIFANTMRKYRDFIGRDIHANKFEYLDIQETNKILEKKLYYDLKSTLEFNHKKSLHRHFTASH